MTERETASSAPHPGTGPRANGQRVSRAIARETTPPETADSAPPNVTRRDRGGGRLARFLDQLTPPEPWRHRPASLAAMWRYARRGGWTGPDGLARQAGMWWFRIVALPVTVLCHYTAWTVARPARAATVVALWAVLMQVPILRTLAAAVLPWDPWPLPIP